MSITYNEKDFNVTEIVKAAGFENSKTKYNFRVYGLKKADNPAILIEHRDSIKGNDLIQPVVTFLNNNNVAAKVRFVEKGKSNVYLGIREDLRGQPVLAAKILKTIVYHIEGNLTGLTPAAKIKTKVFKDNTGKYLPKVEKSHIDSKLIKNMTPEWMKPLVEYKENEIF